MSVHAIYASTSGNVEVVVEKIAELVSAAGIQIELHRAEQTPIEIFDHNDTFILATSTWDHGHINPFFQRLYNAMKEHDFTGKKATFVGLGDIRYEHVMFNGGIKKLHKVWLSRGGTEVHRQLLINGEPYHILDTTVTTWTKDFIEALKAEPHAT